MNRNKQEGPLLYLVTLLLLLNVLTGCWPIKPDPPYVMPESKAEPIKKGNPASFDGWLISASGLARILEQAERCK